MQHSAVLQLYNSHRAHNYSGGLITFYAACYFDILCGFGLFMVFVPSFDIWFRHLIAGNIYKTENGIESFGVIIGEL